MRGKPKTVVQLEKERQRKEEKLKNRIKILNKNFEGYKEKAKKRALKRK